MAYLSEDVAHGLAATFFPQTGLSVIVMVSFLSAFICVRACTLLHVSIDIYSFNTDVENTDIDAAGAETCMK